MSIGEVLTGLRKISLGCCFTERMGQIWILQEIIVPTWAHRIHEAARQRNQNPSIQPPRTCGPSINHQEKTGERRWADELARVSRHQPDFSTDRRLPVLDLHPRSLPLATTTMTPAAGDASRRGGERRKRKEEGGRDRGQEGIGEGWKGKYMGGNFSKGARFPAHAPQCISPRAPSAKISEARVPQWEAARLAEGTGAHEKVTEGGRPFPGSRPRDTHCGWPKASGFVFFHRNKTGQTKIQGCRSWFFCVMLLGLMLSALEKHLLCSSCRYYLTIMDLIYKN